MTNKGRAKSRQGLADMSLPPEERGRKNRTASRLGAAPAAQAGHATGPRARKKARQGEKALRRDRKDLNDRQHTTTEHRAEGDIMTEAATRDEQVTEKTERLKPCRRCGEEGTLLGSTIGGQRYCAGCACTVFNEEARARYVRRADPGPEFLARLDALAERARAVGLDIDPPRLDWRVTTDGELHSVQCNDLDSVEQLIGAREASVSG